MRDFKVGDKVRIKSIEEIRKIDKGLYGIAEGYLKELQGGVYTISYIYGNNKECELLEDTELYCFKFDFLVKVENYYKDLPDTYSGKLVIEKGQVIEKEDKREILDEVEKEYLRAVIKPFRKSITYIIKETAIDKEYIELGLDYDVIDLPYFKKGKMYKGMISGKEYTLEELGL